jgi:hypothetical protein
MSLALTGSGSFQGMNVQVFAWRESDRLTRVISPQSIFIDIAGLIKKGWTG